MNNDMISLAERCEAATGGDREIDRAIGRIAGAAKEQPDGTWMTYHEDGYTHSINPPAYTASLDAAMTLVPDGWDWAVGTGRKQHMTENGKRPWAWCAPGQNFAMPQDLPLAATPALALCAASLRARALSTARTPDIQKGNDHGQPG